MIRFLVSPLFKQTYVAKVKSNPVLATKFDQFTRSKETEPYGSFGASDKPYNPRGQFAKLVPKLRHAHLTHDLSIAYTVEGSAPAVIKLYGVFSHDEQGTGNPPNVKRQQSLATQMANQRFGSEEMLDPGSTRPTTITQPSAAAPAPRPDYTPRARPDVKPAPQLNPSTDLAQRADQQWSERRFLEQWRDAQDRNAKLALLNRELVYLGNIKQRHKLYPNQVDYATTLITLYNNLTKR